MTESRSDTSDTAAQDQDDTLDGGGPGLSEWAEALAASVGATAWSAEHSTVLIHVDRERWVDAIRAARDNHGLVFFSWLTGVDWSKDVEVGEQAADPETLTERYEVMCRLSSIESSHGAQFVTSLPKDDASVATLVGEFGGAGWHEREAAEMFGIDFVGHPGLDPLYLPDAFEGHPLRKSFPLLSREVKPWPGMVDVEGMPSTENTEAAAMAGALSETPVETSDEGLSETSVEGPDEGAP